MEQKLTLRIVAIGVVAEGECRRRRLRGRCQPNSSPTPRKWRTGTTADNPRTSNLRGYFHLDDADLELVKVRRGAQNKLGFALQLTTARFLGTFLTEPTDVPPNVVAYVAAQLGIHDVACLAEYGARS